MKKQEFTYDIVRRDSFPTQILIRYTNDTDSPADKFDDLRSCRKSVNNHLNMDVFISSEILNDLF
jgi:hypothetical protein